MGNWLVLAFRVKRHFANRQPFANFQHATGRQHVLLCRLAQKIDVEICRHCKSNWPKCAKHGDIERKISQREHRRAGQCAAGADVAFVVCHTHAAGAVAYLVDGKNPPAHVDLRKFPVQKRVHLSHGHPGDVCAWNGNRSHEASEAETVMPSTGMYDDSGSVGMDKTAVRIILTP
jgi:hypothetical protein